ncbi:MAG TPA: flagellar hook protein FlgE [Candidatus Angelobacter sp.]|nr:flagellar hook protein FlgE [Candidatus Angelobacter sp.]
MPSFSIPLSGLTADSTALSAIANNLANQNTTGYKDVRVQFSDLFYQNLGTTGSGDPIQLGAGAQVGSMPGMFTQGSVNSTGVPTDVAIQGDGFFAVQKDGVVSYTRAGDFSVDANNFLVTSEGQQVLGYPAVNGVISTGQGITPLQLGAGTISPPNATTGVTLTTNLNASANVGDTFSTPVTVFDSLGASHVLTVTFTKTAANTWGYSLSIPSNELDPIGTPPAPQTGILSTGTLTFDGTGKLTGPVDTNGNLTNVNGIDVTGLADGASDMSFSWDLLNGATPVITQVAAPSSTSSTQQNGAGSGSLVNFSIGTDGTVTGSFSNGKTAALGQIALATFADNQGLQRVGQTDFTETLASGQAVIGAPGTGGRGGLSGGALELSNVDIATEFANLIVAQRAFEANAKAVTTFDQITQDTINLKP